jgi:cell division protein FtsN
MRIDYSEPKKSCSSPQPTHIRPRKESSGGVLAAAFISGLLCLGIGFASGWMLSQRSAKKGFKAAMEQQSFENSQQQVKPQPLSPQPAPPTSTQQQQAAATTPQSPIPGTSQGAADPQLSFYKTLPSGQKNNVLGSGINAKEDKPAKQPLQAAIPTNLTRPVAPQSDDNTPIQTTKPVSHQEATGFTVQIASCSLKSEAETYRTKLATKGYNVNIVESNQGEKGTWYRVHVGKRLDQDSAKELAKKLGKGAIVIPDKE